MTLSPLSTPLAVVQYELWSNTDRNPSDEAAVALMINEAVSTLGNEAESFTAGLVRSLDPALPGGLGVTNFGHLERIGNLLDDDSARRVEQWGALSLLGALSITHNPDIHRSPDSVDHAVYRAQLAGSVARRLLDPIVRSKNYDQGHQALLEALLSHTKMRTEDLSAELVLYKVGTDPLLKQKVLKIDEAETSETLTSTMGSRIGEAVAVTFLPLSETVQNIFEKMDWLDTDFRSTTEQGIFHDGKQVASLIDLTGGHPKLRKYKAELESDPKLADQFWKRLATAVVQYIDTGRANRVKQEKVPTYYESGGGSNDSITRAYYVPLGKDPYTGVHNIGLIAACRTKAREEQVLRLITKGGKSLAEY
jgi:hypothetical protein